MFTVLLFKMNNMISCTCFNIATDYHKHCDLATLVCVYKKPFPTYQCAQWQLTLKLLVYYLCCLVCLVENCSVEIGSLKKCTWKSKSKR
jgi:hypothetical protein